MSKFAEAALKNAPITNQTEVSVEDTGSWFSGEDGNATFYQLDGDSFADQDGNKYRLAGAHAPETTKITPGREYWFSDNQGIDINEGQPFGEATNRAIERVIKEGGFNRVVKTGDHSYDREVIHMTNDKGEDLTHALYRAGVLKPTQFTSSDMVEAFEQGELARQMGVDTGYNSIMEKLDEEINNQKRRTGTGLQMFGMDAIDEADYAGIREASGLHNYVTGTLFDDPNRDKNNVARNSIGASAYTGWVGMKEGFYGAAELLGFEDFGEAGLSRTEQQRLGLAEIENISFDDVNGIGDFVQYVGNNAAMSAPYLGLAATGALLTPITGGGSLAATAAGLGLSAVPSGLVYSGQIWNEMEGEKNAGAALLGGFAAGLVDRLGVGAIIKPSAILTKAGQQQAAQHLVSTGRFANLADATKHVTTIAKQEARDMLQVMGKGADDMAQSFVNRGNLIRDAGVGALRGGIGEGLTEATQESIQYATAVAASEREFNPMELEDRVRDALIAGSTLGAGFGTAADVWAYGDRQALQRDLETADLKHLNDIDQVRENLRREGQVIETVDQIKERVQSEVADWEVGQKELKLEDIANREKGLRRKKKSRIGSFARRADDFQKNKRGFLNAIQNVDSIPDAIAKGVTGFGKLFTAAGRTAFSPQELSNQKYGRTLRDIRALVGQARGVINPGRGFEAQIDKIFGSLAQQIYRPEVFGRFGTKDTQKNRAGITKLLRQYADPKHGRDGKSWMELVEEGDPITDAPKEIRDSLAALRQTAKEFNKLGDNMWKVQDTANRNDGGEGIGYTKGWWWKHQDFDPSKVQKNKKGWYEFMRTHTNLSEQELNDFYDRIVGGDASSMEDYFSHVRGIEFEPGQHQRRDAKLSEKEGFDAFAREDIFATMDSSIGAASRYAASRDYFGAGGKNLDYLFDQLEAEGMPKDKIDEVAWYTKSIIDASTGNFNRITNPRWAATQKMAATISVFAGLPLSAFSSIPESAMIALGLDRPEVAGAISKVGHQFAKQFGETATQIAEDMVTSGQIREVTDRTGKERKPDKAQKRLNEAGLYWTPSSAAKKLGVGETNINYAWLQDKFFRGIGLTDLTQAQRRASAAVVTDFVSSRLSELQDITDPNQMTNRQQHLYNQLAELGMEVDAMIELWNTAALSSKDLDYVGDQRDVTPEQMEFIDRNMQNAVYNFTNMRVQNPGAVNRPLFFQDPHYQMLTQFNGFISTFTANVVPKLWNDYIKRGTPQVKYNTFALMLTMMALGAGSQYLKDEIKYGKSSPYLSDPQLLQRAIYSSGVLGQAERAVDIVLPLYGGRPRSSADWVLDVVLGEAGPTVRNVGTLGTALGAVSQGEGQRAAENLLKLTPVSPFNRLRKGLSETFVGGDFLEGFNTYEE